MDWCSLTLAQRSSVQDYQNGGDWLHQEVYWGYGGSIEGFVTLGYGRSISLHSSALLATTISLWPQRD